uniref:Homeodomain-containing protein n=1 Tax=Tanacetum cinerariifolium TaxID=118510 RepID=A0A6L2J941_TANCI|nr:homeodomain-containing protein [Tanacetum cinerariifolium]
MVAVGHKSPTRSEPQRVQANENGALFDKKPKRIHKTPNQLVALENLYNEHKYPSEAIKLEVAESIGLSEKQVIWAEFVRVFALSGGIPDGYNQGEITNHHKRQQ